MLLRTDTMRRRLNSRCKGLLEVGRPATNDPSSQEPTVQYLHRTVKDYIEDEDIQATLKATLTSPFDAHLKLAAGYVSHIKATDDNVDFFSDHTLKPY
jgi:hypothetical protein